DVSAAFDASAEGETGAAAVDAAVDVDAIATALDAAVDTAVDARVDATPVDATMVMDVGADVAQYDAGPGSLGMGLVAFYPFDEASGTNAGDGSGNGQTATMNGATFAPGQRGNAATLDGTNQYVSLPTGIVSSLTQCSISFWVNLVVSSARGHIFDWGTGNTAYMSISNNQFAISVGGINAEERIHMPSLPTGIWRHVVVTLAGSVGTIYVNGVQAGQNAAMTLTPSSLGMTTRNWLGRSQDPTDLYLTGQIDEFRIYRRALTPAEVQQLFQLRL
ncbi:MAG: LamG domain-containing protein, partial [Myxococcota bacterium]|nr:LamG domain-containing protein [Myxococcota bacterium]